MFALVAAILLSGTPLHANEAVHIAISSAEVEALGGWPLDRKWYAIAVQNLLDSGAERIFIDLAFANADIIHPESDAFFYDVLQKPPQVFLLTAPGDSARADSIKILGRHALPAGRFYLPFASAFSVVHDRLLLKPGYRQTLMKWLLPADFREQNLLIPFPESARQPDASFTEAIQNGVDCSGKDVFIYLDYPGVTSYIAHGSAQMLLSTSELQWHAAAQIRRGNFAQKWPFAQIAGLFALALLPLVGYRLSSAKTRWLLASLALGIALFIGLRLAGIFLPTAWLGIAVVPAGLLVYENARRFLAAQSARDRRTAPAQNRAEHTATADEVKVLREKLDFYEHLTNQTPSSQLRHEDHPAILYHPKSPLVPVLQKAAQLASSDIPVMLLGESGIGKEQLARFIHEKSPRAEKPFVAINCASLNENLIESELFGYEAGAFTGAAKRKIGRFELADGGTLFLDEVAETSLAFQAKLLRVLQESTFERVGGIESVRVSVRIVAATHRDLRKTIDAGQFREDLFFRLNGYVLQLPPLRCCRSSAC